MQPTLRSLFECCQMETEQFLTGHPIRTTCCAELWSRALLEHSNQAWEYVMVCYGPYAMQKVRSHECTTIVLRFRDERSLVDEAFANMAAANRSEPIQISNLPRSLIVPKLLTYLAKCVDSVMRMARRREPGTFLSIDDPKVIKIIDPTDPFEPIEREPPPARLTEVQILRRCVHDEREWHLLDLRHVQDLKPQDIVKEFPGDFPDIDEVYQILARILACCRRHMKRWQNDAEQSDGPAKSAG